MINITIECDDCGLTIDDLIGEPMLQIAHNRRSRYILGTEALSTEEMESIAEDNRYWSAPVYAYIHGGVTISMGTFGCPWDSGQSGIVYREKAALAKDFGHKRWNQHTARKAHKAALATVEELDLILRGEVYRYEITDAEGNHLDSCSGFVGEKWCREAAEEAAEYYRKQEQQNDAWRTTAAPLDSASL
jgi:hypothetical protein